jgi:hypothetical protein
MTLKIQVLIWDRHKHAAGLIRSISYHKMNDNILADSKIARFRNARS